MIVGPWGEILAEVTEETGIAIAKIDIEKQANIRKRFPVLTHKKLD
jgi:nitrilase